MTMATLKDVAALAGVSRSTAGLVLSGRGDELRIGSACAERVRAAARELRYRGNYLARSLSVGRSHTIGFAMGFAEGRHHLYWWPIVEGAVVRSRTRGYDMLLLGMDDGRPSVEHALHSIEDHRIDALLVPEGRADRLAMSGGRPWPVVLVNHVSEGGYPGVRLDERPGIEAAVEHLRALGHRRLIWIGMNEEGRERSPQRSRMLRESAGAAGMDVDEIRLTWDIAAPALEQRVGAHRAELERLFRPDREVTAAVCYNDAVALALLSILRDRGAPAPADLSVVGFDDLWAGLAVPRLTTIRHELGGIGAAAADLAIDLVEGGGAYPCEREIAVPSSLVVRESTGPVRETVGAAGDEWRPVSCPAVGRGGE
jgi:LacI family transcriptional regulator